VRPVRVVAPRIEEMLADIPDSEREFYNKARQKTRMLEDARKDAADRRAEDELSIESLANAILDLTNGDMSVVADLSHAEIAAAADVPVKAASRLHKDAYWLARDHLETEKLKARGIERNETEYERNLRIANDALMSAAISHGNGRETPYSNRQLHLVGEADKREQYLKRVQYEPCPERFEQSARDRFDGRGYLFDKPAWIGGASTQPNGGTCYQESTHEKGKRSATSICTARVVAMVAKAPGKCRRGIADKTVIQRILHLEMGGKSVAEIATDVGEKPGRVRGVIHRASHDDRFWSGLNNDVRHVHLKKWAALDQVHGNTRTDCREIIRVDKDRVFYSWQEFIEWLSKLKVQPQQITFVRDDLHPEWVVKPHLLYILPEGRGVWYNNGLCMAMFEAVAAALTVDAGGDIGGLANVGDLKLPTSPHNIAIDWNVEHWPTLSELCKVLDVDLKRNIVVTMRQQSVAQMIEAGLSKTQSAAIYTLVGKRGFELCLLWQKSRELRVDGDLDRRHLGDEIAEALLEDRFVLSQLEELSGAKRAAAENTIHIAAKSVAEAFGRGRKASGRGYDLRVAEDEVKKAVAEFREHAPADLTPEQLAKKEIDVARGVGGHYCNRVQVGRSVRRISDAMLEISKTGIVPDDRMVERLSGMDIRTVRARWHAAVAFVAANHVVAKIMGAPPVVPEPENRVDTTPAPDAAKCSSVWGVKGERSPINYASDYTVPVSSAIPATSGETLTLETMIPATIRPLVKVLLSRQPAPGMRPTGLNLLEFVRSGATIYRPSLGIRAQAHRRRRGRAERDRG
jgi:hypothetical protein